MTGQILIVDDEENVAFFLKESLIAAEPDVVVEAVESGEAALSRLENQSFDLVITDLKMPGMDGLALVKWGGTHYPETQFIVMTGYHSLDSKAEAYRSGVCHYITKPFQIETLIDMTHTILTKSQKSSNGRSLSSIPPLAKSKRKGFLNFTGSEARVPESLAENRKIVRSFKMLAEWIKNRRGRLINAYIAQSSGTKNELEERVTEERVSARTEALTRFVAAPMIALLIRVLQGKDEWVLGIQKIAQNALNLHEIPILESLRGVQTIHRIIRKHIQDAADRAHPADRALPAEVQTDLPTQQVTWLSQLADLEAKAAYAIAQIQEENHSQCTNEFSRSASERCRELERYHNLYARVPEGIALHEIIYAESTAVDYVVLDTNPAYEDIWGMRQVPVSIGQKASDVYNRGNIPYLEIYAEVAMSGNPTAFEITDRLLGTTFYVSVFSPTKGQFATLVRDITQRKRMEEKHQKLIAVLENSDDFIGLVTFEGQSFYVNAAGRKMLGLEGDGRFVHTAFFEYFRQEDMPYIRQQVLPTVVEEGEWEGQLNFRDMACGMDIPVYCNIFVVKDTNNQTKPPLGLGIMGRSIDKYRRMTSTYEIDTDVALKVPLIPVAPLGGDLEASAVETSEQTKVLTQALLAGIREQQATRASRLVVLDIAALETTLEALAALQTQTTLSHAMTEALKKLGIDVDPPKTQSQG